MIRVLQMESGTTPRWSVMIPTYNADRYLRDALESVLAQDPGPDVMQIEVVDDGSEVDPRPLVKEIAGDRVSVHRHDRNMGHVAAFNTCIDRAQGEYVHLLHADDEVRPGFYERLGAALDANPAAGAAFCRYIAIDDHGNWTNISDLEQPVPGILDDWLAKIATGQRLQPPCIVVRKSVYDAVGLFDARIRSYGEDWEMWTRIAASFPVWYEPEPLALYRVSRRSLSSHALHSGDNVRQLMQVIELNRTRLPVDDAENLTTAARRSTATAAIRRGVRLAALGDLSGALAQLRWSLRADRSPSTLSAALLGTVRIVRARVSAGRR